jgi:hypothetical protein
MRRANYIERLNRCRNNCNHRFGNDTPVWGDKGPGFWLRKLGQVLCYAACGLLKGLTEICNIVCDLLFAPKQSNDQLAQTEQNAQCEEQKCLADCDHRPNDEKASCRAECEGLKKSMSEGAPQRVDFNNYEEGIKKASCEASCKDLQVNEKSTCINDCIILSENKEIHIRDHPKDLEIRKNRNECIANCQKTAQGQEFEGCKSDCTTRFVT